MSLPNLGLHEIAVDAFKGLDSLKMLFLYDNSMGKIENGTFDCLPKLTTLFLHGNKLKSLEPGLFDKLSDLTELCLDRNPLSVDLHADTFRGLGNLKKLNLSRTPLAQAIEQQSPIIRKHHEECGARADQSRRIEHSHFICFVAFLFFAISSNIK